MSKVYCVEVSVWYNTRTVYGVATMLDHRYKAIGTREELCAQLAKYADTHALKIDKSVNGVHINRDTRAVFALSGWSATRGLYWDELAQREEVSA